MTADLKVKKTLLYIDKKLCMFVYPCIVALRLLLYRVPTQTPALFFFEMKKSRKTEMPPRVQRTPRAADGKTQIVNRNFTALSITDTEGKSNEN